MTDPAAALHALLDAGLVLRLFRGRPERGAWRPLPEGDGYQALPLPRRAWTLDEGPPAKATTAERKWTFSAAAGRVDGWVLTTAGGDLVALEAFEDGPYEVAVPGSTVGVSPEITLAGG